MKPPLASAQPLQCSSNKDDRSVQCFSNMDDRFAQVALRACSETSERHAPPPELSQVQADVPIGLKRLRNQVRWKWLHHSGQKDTVGDNDNNDNEENDGAAVNNDVDAVDSDCSTSSAAGLGTNLRPKCDSTAPQGSDEVEAFGRHKPRFHRCREEVKDTSTDECMERERVNLSGNNSTTSGVVAPDKENQLSFSEGNFKSLRDVPDSGSPSPKRLPQPLMFCSPVTI